MRNSSLYVYLLIVGILSFIFIYVFKSIGEQGNYFIGLYMLVPAIAAFITRLFFYENKFKDAHLKFGRWKDYLRFWLVTLIIVIFSYLIYTILGSISWDFSGDTFLKQLGEQMESTGQSMDDLPAGMTPKMMLIIYFVGGLTIFNIPLIVAGFGEEFGWRGFMFPLLCRKRLITGFIIGGLIWFAWHVPLLFIMPESNDFTLWQHILNFFILAIGSVCSFVFFAYVYVKSGTIWVASFVHAVFNNSARSFSQYAIVEDQLLANLGLTITMMIVVGILYFRKEFKIFREFFTESME